MSLFTSCYIMYKMKNHTHTHICTLSIFVEQNPTIKCITTLKKKKEKKTKITIKRFHKHIVLLVISCV